LTPLAPFKSHGGLYFQGFPLAPVRYRASCCRSTRGAADGPGRHAAGGQGGPAAKATPIHRVAGLRDGRFYWQLTSSVRL